MTAGIVASVFAAALLVWCIVVFNRLVRLRSEVRTVWADCDVHLTRRHDLVPPLVASVEAYAGHARATLAIVTDRRARAMRTREPAALGALETALDQALDRLLALHAAYPDLHASGNFLQLQRDLVDVEPHFQHARRFYHGAVRDHHAAVQRARDLLIARLAQVHVAGFFQTDPVARDVVANGALR